MAELVEVNNEVGGEETIPVFNENGSLNATPTPVDAGTVEAAAPSFEIPEAYKDKKYLQGIDSQEKVYEMLDNAQSLIGKRPGLPTSESSEDDWNKFYNDLGRPDSADKYEFKEIELPEGTARDEGFTQQSTELMHKLGLSQNQASGLREWFDGYTLEALNKQQETLKTDNEQWENLANEYYGDNKDQIMADAKDLIKENLPDKFEGALDSFSNEHLLKMAGVLHNIKNKYISEDSLSKKDAHAAPALTPAEYHKKVLQFISNPAYTDQLHPEHEAIYMEGQKMYEALDKMRLSQK